jgi:uncharacterized protein YlaI
MQVRCAICSRPHEVAKWQDDYERLRETQRETYICDACQARVRRDAQKDTFPHSS